jgi:hypothetical protein
MLAISGDYDAFIRQPSGVIEREFGQLEPSTFRLDVSGPIDEGDSWQLGVYAAHMLAAAGRLAPYEESTKMAIWLTGSVDNDLLIGPVAHLPEKLHASRDEFIRLLAEGVSVTLFVPRGGRELAERAKLPSMLTLVEVHNTSALGSSLGLKVNKTRPGRASAGSNERRSAPVDPPKPRWTGLSWLYKILLATALGIAIATIFIALPKLSAWSDLTARGEFGQLDDALSTARQGTRLDRRLTALAYENWLASQRPGRGDIEVTLDERRAPEGHTCAAVHFGNVEAVRSRVTRNARGEFAASSYQGLCGLEFTVVATKQSLYAAALLQVISGRYFQAVPLPRKLIGRESFFGRQGWAIDLPWRLHEAFSYSIEVVAATYPVNDALRWWLDSNDPARASERAGELGLWVLSWHHKVVP